MSKQMCMSQSTKRPAAPRTGILTLGKLAVAIDVGHATELVDIPCTTSARARKRHRAVGRLGEAGHIHNSDTVASIRHNVDIAGISRDAVRSAYGQRKDGHAPASRIELDNWV